MIGAFLDESFDMASRGVFAVGGLMGRGIPIYELERRWERIRTRSDVDLEYFKASKCERGNGPFSKFVTDPKNINSQERARLDGISHEFLHAIASGYFDKSYIVMGGTGIIQEDFYEVIKDAKACAVLGKTPFRLAYDLAMIQCVWAMKQVGLGDVVSFICDESEEHSHFAYDAYSNLKKTNPRAAEYMGTFSMGDEKYSPALQAADAVVYEIRRALGLSLKQWRGSLRKQFSLLEKSEGMFLIQYASKENLQNIVATHQPEEPYKLDQIMKTVFGENIKLTI